MPVKISCPIQPTDDRNRVIDALAFLHPDVSSHIEEDENGLSITFVGDEREFLFHLRQHIHDNRVIDVFRRIIESNRSSRGTSFSVDKQAAYVNRLRLIDSQNGEPPLGSIKIEISMKSSDALDAFLNWFVPPTEDGRIIFS